MAKIEEKGSTSKKPLNMVVVVLIIVMIVAIGWLLFDRYQQQKVTEQMIAELEETTSEKNAVTEDLNGLLTEYEDIQTDNAQLSQEIQQQEERIKELIDEVQSVRASNSAQIREYRQELETLRKVMKSYIYQVDSLNTLTQELEAEKEEYRESYEEQRNVNRQLTSETENLNEQLEQAAALKATGINVTGLNSRGRSTDKLDKINKIQVCFTLAANEIAETGARQVYIRIADPNGLVLTMSDTDFFEYQGKEITYSALRTVRYEGEDVNSCIYYTKSEILPPGTYSVDVIVDDQNAGSYEFVLK